VTERKPAVASPSLSGLCLSIMPSIRLSSCIRAIRTSISMIPAGGGLTRPSRVLVVARSQVPYRTVFSTVLRVQVGGCSWGRVVVLTVRPCAYLGHLVSLSLQSLNQPLLTHRPTTVVFVRSHDTRQRKEEEKDKARRYCANITGGFRDAVSSTASLEDCGRLVLC